MFAGPVVPRYDHLIHNGDLALIDAHLKIDGVIFYAHLHRCQLEEEVTVIQVHTVHRVLVNKEPVVEHLLVEYIPLFNPKHQVQVLGRGEAYYKSDFLPSADYSGFEDPLQYVIQKAGPMGLEVHAWINAFLVWSAPWEPESSDHVYHAHPEWFTAHANGRSSRSYTQEQAEAVSGDGWPQLEEFLKQEDDVLFDWISGRNLPTDRQSRLLIKTLKIR